MRCAPRLGCVRVAPTPRERRGVVRARRQARAGIVAAGFLLIAALVAAAGCGAERVPAEESSAVNSSATTARMESVFRFSDEDETEELRSSGVIDFAHDRSSGLDPI